MKTKSMLTELAKKLQSPKIPSAKEEWYGADLAISTKKREPRSNFYPEPRVVVTPHSRELSWLFFKLRDAFYAENLLDHCTKIEFFGRLGNAANRCLNSSHEATPHLLYATVLYEAFAIYDEIERGDFCALEVALGNEICDDSKETEVINQEELIVFFRNLGITNLQLAR